jgi:hypothetical protein
MTIKLAEYPEAVASALMVVVALTLTAALKTGELVVGVVPSVV